MEYMFLTYKELKMNKWSSNQIDVLQTLASVYEDNNGVKYYISWKTISKALNYLFGAETTSNSVRKKYVEIRKNKKDKKRLKAPSKKPGKFWNPGEINILVYLTCANYYGTKDLTWDIKSSAIEDVTGYKRSANSCRKKYYSNMW